MTYTVKGHLSQGMWFAVNRIPANSVEEAMIKAQTLFTEKIDVYMVYRNKDEGAP